MVMWCTPEVHFLTWINFNPNMDKFIKYGLKLLIHSPTSTVQSLKFENAQKTSSLTLLGIWLHIHAGIKVNSV